MFFCLLKLLIFSACCNVIAFAKVLDFEKDAGAIKGVRKEDVAWYNGKLLNKTLATLEPGDELVFSGGEFYIMGGIVVNDKKGITITINSKVLFSGDTRKWPRDVRQDVLDSWIFINCEDIIITGAFQYGKQAIDISAADNSVINEIDVSQGVIDGNGAHWWHFPFLGYLIHQENRPRIIRMIHCRNILVENILLVNSPYWTTLFENVTNLEVRQVEIINRRTVSNLHTAADMSALNTDGIDVTGRYVHVHDVTIWTQDDCIAVKDGSEHMLFENINASGLGLVVGSIGSSHNRNITFRNAYLYKTVKAIYLKFRRKDDESREYRCPCAYDRKDYGLIEDVLFENIVIDQPEQFAIWLGPAQQSDKVDPSSCNLHWPLIPGAICTGQQNGKFRNILMRNISIQRPLGIGLFLGTAENPMENIQLDNVRVDYHCGDEELVSYPEHFSIHDSLVDASNEYVNIGLTVIGITAAFMCPCFQRNKWRCIGILLALFIYGSIIHFINDFIKPEQYSLCEHVINGTATGDTWPVPDCFSTAKNTSGDISCLEDFDHYHSFTGTRWLEMLPTYLLLSTLPIVVG